MPSDTNTSYSQYSNLFEPGDSDFLTCVFRPTSILGHHWFLVVAARTCTYPYAFLRALPFRVRQFRLRLRLFWSSVRGWLRVFRSHSAETRETWYIGHLEPARIRTGSLSITCLGSGACEQHGHGSFLGLPSCVTVTLDAGEVAPPPPGGPILANFARVGDFRHERLTSERGSH